MNGHMQKAQRGIGGGSRGSKHQLLFDQSVAKGARSRRTNLANQESLRFSAPFVDTGMREAVQDRPQVSDFHKAINISSKDNFIRKLKE